MHHLAGSLVATDREIEAIAALLEVEPLIESRVLEKALKACRSPYILHLATHGFFSPDLTPGANTGPSWRRAMDMMIGDRWDTFTRLENPLLRSGLALAGANTWLRGGDLSVEAEDGILTAEDVTGMDLLDTEMVALLACETGLGQIHVGAVFQSILLGSFHLSRDFGSATKL